MWSRKMVRFTGKLVDADQERLKINPFDWRAIIISKTIGIYQIRRLFLCAWRTTTNSRKLIHSNTFLWPFILRNWKIRNTWALSNSIIDAQNKSYSMKNHPRKLNISLLSGPKKEMHGWSNQDRTLIAVQVLRLWKICKKLRRLLWRMMLIILGGLVLTSFRNTSCPFSIISANSTSDAIFW